MAKNQPSLSEIYSGSYTPEVTINDNITNVGTWVAKFVRIGNIIHVSGFADNFQATVGESNITIHISLPIPTNITESSQLSGTGADINSRAYRFIGGSSFDGAVVRGLPMNDSLTDISFSFTYILK
jgi:hypothetical protein